MTAQLAILPPVESSLCEIVSLHEEVNGLGRTTIVKAIRIGELLTGIKIGLRHGSWLPWVRDNLPFSQQCCSNYMRLFDNRDKLPTVGNLELTEAYRLLFGSAAHVSHNSGDNEWFTPAEIIDRARLVLGKIDLDPASSAEANKVVEARRFFSKRDDGLSRKWSGNVWMNPPYESDLIGKFTAKLSHEFSSGNVSQALALVNNATETDWFSDLGACASAICFPNKRVRFWHPKKPTCSPLQGQAIFYLGRSPRAFLKHFSTLGMLCHVVQL